MNKLSRLFISSFLFFTASAVAFADEPTSSLDDKPSVDTAAASGVQVPSVPSDATAATHTSYLYDLKKLIEKSRENIKEVNDKIKEQAVLKRNQEREERAHEYYEKGVELTKEGKLDEAREYFEKAIRITEHPEMVGYIAQSQRRLRRQEAALQAQEHQHLDQIKQDENARKEDVETAYKEAIDLYRQKKYHPAKDAFNHVDEIAPDYRATRSYLKIIDQDIILADAVALKQKAVEQAQQQKEAEAARAQEKAKWLQQIEAKEKERKEQVDKQADEAYNEAIDLYKNKKFAEAKKKFEEVSWVIPDYKDTMRYLRRIDKDAQAEQEHVTEEKQKSLEEQHWEELVASKKEEVARQHELAVKEIKHRKELEEQAAFLYTAAVTLFDKKDMDGAWQKFTDIEKTCPDYKSTRSYLARIEQTDPKYKPLPPPTVVLPSTPVNPEQAELSSSLEDQQKQVQEISDLVRRAAAVYVRVVDIDDDRLTAQMRRKLAEVNKILNALMHNKERLLREMRQKQSKLQQEESKAAQEKHKDEAEKIYKDAVKYYQDHDYERAEFEFLQLENIIPDYKDTQHYLRRLEEEQNKPNPAGPSGYEQNETDHLKQLKNNENSEESLHNKQEEEKKHNIEMQQQMALEKLAQKASDINDDIITLSRAEDYEAMKAKFTELENTVTALTALKDSMSKQKDIQKQLADEAKQHKAFQPPPDVSQYKSYQPSPDVDHFKRSEIKQEQNMMYSQAVSLYREKKYVQAKLLFTELDSQNDRRADGWIKKVDRAIAQSILKGQAEAERERTAFIAEQLKAQHQLVLIQERERQRQKKLAEEMERQKRQLEDDRALQLRKEATLKAQEQERERQEEKRLKLEKEAEKEQEAYRFHRIAQPSSTVAAASTVQQPAVASASLPAQNFGVVSSQADLEARRRAVRKQLEDGVEVMYKEAVGLYKHGNYTAALGKFKDIEDILPGYKHTEQYISESNQRSVTEKPQEAVAAPVAPDSSASIPTTTPVAVPAASSVSHEDAVSKALDLFDSNVK